MPTRRSKPGTGQHAEVIPFRGRASVSKKQAREKFGERLTAARKMAGYEDRRPFARHMGIEEMTYGRWERGETEPPLFQIIRLCDELQVTADFLILGIPKQAQ